MTITAAACRVPREAVVTTTEGELCLLFRLPESGGTIVIATLHEAPDWRLYKKGLVLLGAKLGWRKIVITKITVEGTSLGGMTATANGMGEVIIPEEDPGYDTGCNYRPD